jgi:HipA-like protein
VAENIWLPTTFLSYVRTVPSSSRTARIQTDAGAAYLKAINNPEGPHVLACDWFGTQLARRFGLRTFDVAVLEIGDLDEIPLNGSLAQQGTAFVSRAEEGVTMGGQRALSNVENIGDLSRLVVFDTWVRNCDRYAPNWKPDGEARVNPDNLFLSTDGAPEGKFVLKAIDHGHIFTCGKPLTSSLAHIENIHDERSYGLFPFFLGYVTSNEIVQTAKALRDVRSELWADLLRSIPIAWEVSQEAKHAIDRFLLERARFLADNFPKIAPSMHEQGTLSFDNMEGGRQ